MARFLHVLGLGDQDSMQQFSEGRFVPVCCTSVTLSSSSFHRGEKATEGRWLIQGLTVVWCLVQPGLLLGIQGVHSPVGRHGYPFNGSAYLVFVPGERKFQKVGLTCSQ